MSDSDQLVKRFLSLPTEQQAEFLRKLSQQGISLPAGPDKESNDVGATDALRFKNGRFCPHCDSVHVCRYGKQADGTQRYRCSDCHKTLKAT